MRGNERCSDRGRASGVRLFPIPMRGNELKAAAFYDDVVTFPIPMRGNEDWVERIASLGFDRFPIPMRGNEQTCIRADHNGDMRFRSP